MTRKIVSSIREAMDSVRLCTFTRPPATSRHALKNRKEYLLGQVELSQIHPIPVYCIGGCTNSSCFAIILKS